MKEVTLFDENDADISGGSQSSGGDVPPLNEGNKGTLGYRLDGQECNPNTIMPN